MKKYVVIFLFTLIVFSFKSITIKAATKKEVPYEINNISIDANKKLLLIDGWGFITDAQNFLNSSTHRYYLDLKAADHSINAQATIRNISHTDTMALLGSRWCNNNEYDKPATICNHRYDNIGFRFSIPLKDLKMDREYVATLRIEAIQSKINKSITIYFPVKDKLVLKDNAKNYVIDSKLNDLSLKVVFERILVRDKAGKTGIIQQSKLNCSQNKSLYYKTNAIFNKVYDKTLLNSTTYYKLSAKEVGCTGGRAYVNDGNTIFPVWIASNFVEYVGQPLIVKTHEDNSSPIISIKNHPIIYVGDNINYFEGVSAYDKEDGDISHKLVIYSNSFQNKVGNYEIKLRVTDSKGLQAQNTKKITVLRRNFPPVINAFDVEITQFSNFNPYLNVSAFDQDAEDISNKIITTNTVDTSRISTQSQCYTVVDKYNLKTDKCINVKIIKAKSNFRLIQKQRLFFKEELPMIWRDKLVRITSEINNNVVYKQRNISK